MIIKKIIFYKLQIFINLIHKQYRFQNFELPDCYAITVKQKKPFVIDFCFQLTCMSANFY